MNIRILPCVLLASALGLAGCGTMMTAQNGSSSALAGESSPGAEAQAPVFRAAQVDVNTITVTVPRTLTVSEANLYHPNTDIVWRGEPLGDRYVQIEAILGEAMDKGTEMMTEGRKVDIEVTLLRFHCLTEKARYVVGGVHSLSFELTVRDAETGAILDGPRKVVANTKAAGGQRAVNEDLAGRTQRVVVVERLAEAIHFELTGAALTPNPEAMALADAPVIAPQVH